MVEKESEKIMVWGKKKPTEFDQAQDKQLKQLMANQKVLINNNAHFIKQNKNLWSWINWLEKHVKTLESRMTANEKKDLEQAQLFANLSQSAKQTEEVSSES
jgi:hypothetical protein